jgi:hypothetical protein
MKMKINHIKLLLLLPLLAIFAVGAHAQGAGVQCATALTTAIPVCPLIQTTLSAAVGAGNGIVSGLNSAFQNQVVLTAVTGVSAPVNGQIQTILYIDREAMAVTSVNTTTLVVGVERGYLSTQANAHVSGDMVLLGAPFQFYSQDPSGACTSTNIASTPYLNAINGLQWLCSSVTGKWVPGFGNFTAPLSLTTLVADAAGAVTPSGPLFQMGGSTNAVTGFNIPVGCDATSYGSCQFTAIATTAWTWTASGNIVPANTTLLAGATCGGSSNASCFVNVAGQAVTFVWNPTSSKWNPVL